MRRPQGTPNESAAGVPGLSYTKDVREARLDAIDDEQHGQTREQPVRDAEENTQGCAVGGRKANAQNPPHDAVG